MKSTKPWKVGRTMQNQVGIGKQDFAALRESQCFYIDKTSYGSGGTTGMMLR